MMHEHEWPSTRELARARFARFLKEFTQYERQESRREKLDAFLDAYSLWLKTRAPHWRLEVERLADELHALDVRFEFHLDREPVG